MALLIAALVGGGAMAAAVGVQAYRYHFVGRDADGVYHFSGESQTVYERTSEDANGVVQHTTVTISSAASAGADDSGADAEQRRQDLEEIAQLRAQDQRRLVRVGDTRVNGYLRRTLVYEYTLADGRTITVNETDPNRHKDMPRTPAEIERDFAEVDRLREQGLYEVIRVTDTTVEGQTDRTLSCQYILADGRRIRRGEDDPEWEPPAKRLNSEQIDELWRLKDLGRGERLESFDEPLYGKVFTFETHLITLADGTVVTLAKGLPKVGKTSLSEADWAEYRALRETNAGEDLSPYEDEVRNQVFTFSPKRYTLSDGTEIVHARGVPKTD